VWPRYIVDAPNWIGRANGLMNQPGANGVLLITGYAVAILLATAIDHPRWRRIILWGIAAACGYAVYLTHTRAVYLGFVLVVIAGAVFARGFCRPFVTTLVVLGIGLAVNWQAFTSADRDAGGVASTSEVYDRLNAGATAIWAFFERPWSGWGLGRFPAVNTYHHQRWSEEVPWIRGLGVASHFNELGILAELGIIGLALWLAVLILVFHKLVQGMRTLPPAGLSGRPLALTALMSLSTLVILGLFVDLRLLDYPNTTAFALAGVAAGVLDRYRSASAEPPYVRLPRMRF
jgi:O-antigen ligase